MTAAVTAPVLDAPAPTVDPVDNRPAYAAFAAAWIAGHGSAALSSGPDPWLPLPSWLPTALLAAGIVSGAVAATVAALRARRILPAADVVISKLLGPAWIVGFAALVLLITGLGAAGVSTEVQAVLWPAGSGLVVGLVYLAEGAARRNLLHHALGAWLALVAGASLLVPTPGPFAVLAVAGGSAYVAALVLEHRRHAAA